MTFDGKKLREERLRLGISARQIADLVGVSERSVHNYEMGNTSPIRAAREVMEMKLGLPKDGLLTEEEGGSEAFETGDLGLIAYLYYSGITEDSHYVDGDRITLQFLDGRCEQIQEEYLGTGDNCNARRYSESIRQAKATIMGIRRAMANHGIPRQ